MFSHVTVGCSDIVRATAFFDAILTPLGLKKRFVKPDGGPESSCWVSPLSTLPRFYVYVPYDGKPATVGNGSMVAFAAESIDAVNDSYAAGLKAGGICDGPPGPRNHYGIGYYGAYIRDPDGNKVHIVYRGDIWHQ